MYILPHHGSQNRLKGGGLLGGKIDEVSISGGICAMGEGLPNKVKAVGVEPTTSALKVPRSTTELRLQVQVRG